MAPLPVPQTLYQRSRRAAYEEATAEACSEDSFGAIRHIICTQHYVPGYKDNRMEGILDGMTDAMIDRGHAASATKDFSRVLRGWSPTQKY